MRSMSTGNVVPVDTPLYATRLAAGLIEAKLSEFLSTRKAELMGKLRAEKAFSDALAAEMKAALTEFKQTYR